MGHGSLLVFGVGLRSLGGYPRLRKSRRDRRMDCDAATGGPRSPQCQGSHTVRTASTQRTCGDLYVCGAAGLLRRSEAGCGFALVREVVHSATPARVAE